MHACIHSFIHLHTYRLRKGIYQHRSRHFRLIQQVVRLGNDSNGWTHIARVAIPTVGVNVLRVGGRECL